MSPPVDPPERLPLHRYEIHLPDNWAALPVEPYAGWEDEIISVFTSTDEAAETLRHDLAVIHPAVTTEHHLEIGAYIPDPTTGSVWAAMSMDLIVPDDESPVVDIDLYQVLSEKSRRPGVKVLSRRTERIDVAPGPCLMVTETAEMDRSVVEYHAICTIFPSDSTDAVQLTFTTPHLILTNTMDDHAVFTANSLVLSVAT